MRGFRTPLKILSLAVAVGLFVFPEGVAAEEEKVTRGWYAMSVIQATGLMTVTHLWSKGDLFRSVSVIRGVPVVTSTVSVSRRSRAQSPK